MPKAAPETTKKASPRSPAKGSAPASKAKETEKSPAKGKAAKGAKAGKAKASPKEHSASPAKVEVQVDRALKQRWEKTQTLIKSAKSRGASAFDELWEAVAEVVEHDPPLYLAGGFATAKAFLTANFEETERTAYRNIRVAKYASPHEEEKYGIAKLDLVLSYIEAKLGAPTKGRLPVDFGSLKIPVERDGKAHQVGIEDATAKEIAAATRTLTRTAKKTPVSASPVVAAVTKAFAKGALRAITVRWAGGKLSFGGVAPEAIPELAKALASLKLPVA